MAAKTIAFLDDREWPSNCFSFNLPIDPATTGLCVIDMQNYCVDPQGHLAHSLRLHDPRLFEAYCGRVEGVITRIQHLLSTFRSQGRRIVFTRHGGLLPDGGDLIQRRRSREQVALTASEGQSGHLALAGTPGHQIISQLRPKPGELVLDKNTSSAFNSTSIELFLRNMGLRTLVLTGLVSDQCVLMTALDAADRGFHVIIAADACATIDPGSHEASLLLFRRVWGYVMQSEDVIKLMSGEKTDLQGRN